MSLRLPARIALLILAFFAVISVVGTGDAAIAQPDTNAIDIVEIEGLIDPPTARYLVDRLEGAARDGSDAVILRLDSPGSVEVDVAALIEAVEDSIVPVVAWIAPRGAVAEGTASRLVAAADAFYAADGTTIDSDPPTPPSASSLSALLQALDTDPPAGADVDFWDETNQIPGALLRFQEMPVWDRLLHAVTTPEAALFLLLLGIFGFIFEIYNPGIGIAALLGAVLLGLGLYSLDVLVVRWDAVLVICLALAAFVYDVHIAGFGIWSFIGAASLTGGTIWLFPGGHPAAELELWAIPTAVVLTLVFFVSVMTAALRVRLRRPISDSEGIVGTIGEAQTDIAPEGTVLTNGTLWRARTMETGIAAGSKVEVKATEGLVLLVEPLHEN